MTTNSIAANSVRVERIFNASVDMLWKIWTEPELIMRWFGADPNGTVQSADIDLRVGGKHKVSFMDSDGSVHTAFGQYTLVEMHSRLHYSWEWRSEPGHISEVEVQFVPMGEKTKLILVHKNLSPDSKHGYEMGWNGALDKVERVVKQL